MWDPSRYRDTDYGLEQDESFEPSDAGDEEPPDLAEPFVMTVLGPIAPDQLGICQPHEHVLAGITSQRGRLQELRLERAAEELEAFATVGGRAMVDMTVAGEGRDAAGLLALAQRVPVHLIAATGPHRGDADGRASLTAGTLADLTNGIDGTGVRPGIVVCPEWVSPDQAARVIDAAAGRGWPVMIQGADACGTQMDLESHASDPGRIIVHVNGQTLLEELREVAGRGCWLVFTGAATETGDRLAGTVIDLAMRGHADQLLVSQGASVPLGIRISGEPVWTRLLERFTLELMDAGASAELVRSILIDNPARALAVHPAQ